MNLFSFPQAAAAKALQWVFITLVASGLSGKPISQFIRHGFTS
jgi:hypothetical protein